MTYVYLMENKLPLNDEIVFPIPLLNQAIKPVNFEPLNWLMSKTTICCSIYLLL
jgi:hypothetical protein